MINKLKIAALQKTSLIDFPGKISAIIFTQGCNFRCRYCHNPELIHFDQGIIFNIEEDEVLDFLKTRIDKLDALCITGGEPTIQAGLFEFIKKVKDLSFDVKLDTNGSNFGLVEKLVSENLVDYIAMDYKVHEDLFENVTGASKDLYNRICKTRDYLINSTLKYEFRTTILPKLFSSYDIEKIGIELRGAKKVYLQNFYDNGKLLDQSLTGELGFPPAKLEEFKVIMEKYVEKCEIRN